VLVLGGFHRLTFITKTKNALKFNVNRQNIGAKVYIQEGNSPDRQLRSIIHENRKYAKLQHKVFSNKHTQEVGLEAAIR